MARARGTKQPVANDRFLPLGVVTNLRAGKNRAGRYHRRRLENILGAFGLVRESAMAESLPAILREFHRAGVQAIGVNGGDGTFGELLPAIMEIWPLDRLPALLPLCGGTMNMVAGEYGMHGNPASLLERFVRAVAGRGERLGCFPQKTLRVECSTFGRPRYGFVWAMGMAHSFLREYYRRGSPSVWNAFSTTTGLIAGGPLPLERFRGAWRTVPAEVSVDGEKLPIERVRIAVAAVLNKLVLWFSPFAEGVGEKERGFGFMLNHMEMPQVFRHLWPLCRGRYHGPGHLSRVVQRVEMTLHDGFVLDGEIFSPGERVQVTLSLGPMVSMLAFAGGRLLASL